MFLMRTIGPVSADLPRLAREALYSIDPNQPADQFRTRRGAPAVHRSAAPDNGTDRAVRGTGGGHHGGRA
jgi:hypothetical protein